jgi:predicted molibdopterin-dependent oxidoreductase YjgC
MGTEVSLIINGQNVRVLEGVSILDAADSAQIYIPRLCHHPDLPPGPGTKADAVVYRHGQIATDKAEQGVYDGCRICYVEIEGQGTCLSCNIKVADGMVVHTDTATVRELRRDSLARILAYHPHACLNCAEHDGCNRELCTMGVDEDCRCCDRFDDCEFKAVCQSVTIKDDVSQYSFRNIPLVTTPFFTYDANRCIGCTRCVRICEKLQNKRVIGFALHNNEVVVGTKSSSHSESGCAFCGGCVTVCPAGAMAEKGVAWKKKAELKLTKVTLPPEDMHELTEDSITKVPETGGVFVVYNNAKETIYICGTSDLRRDLKEKYASLDNAQFFSFEEYGMYSMRENELLQKFLKKYERLPEVNDEIADLY